MADSGEATQVKVKAELLQVLARNLPFTTVTGTAIALLAAFGAAPVSGDAVWWSYPVGSTATVLLTALCYRYGGWRKARPVSR